MGIWLASHAKQQAIGEAVLPIGSASWLGNDRSCDGYQWGRDGMSREFDNSGRGPNQPSRQELSQFFRQAEPLLKFERIWFDHAKRQAIGDAFGQVIANRYTVWACAICKNHAHLCIRAHRDPAEIMWSCLTDAGRKVIRRFADVDPEHEVWTRAPYTVFCYTPEDIGDRIEYINGNPLKEGLPPQAWPFVQAYDGWPVRRGLK
jgi:REP element-mobilizing transposase RayT